MLRNVYKGLFYLNTIYNDQPQILVKTNVSYCRLATVLRNKGLTLHKFQLSSTNWTDTDI